MSALRSLCPLILLAALSLPLAVHAEGTSPEESAPVHRVVKKKPKPKPVSAPVTTTDKPIPYVATATAPVTPPPLPPTSVAVATPPVPPAPVDNSPVYATVTVQAPPPTEISLRCETRVMDSKKFVSQGVFYIQIFPSDVFPDEQADFKFLFVDPAHKSLVRQTMCQDIACSAVVSKTAYALINRPTKKGNVLRITLDRTKGAFYAENITKGMTGDSHLGETGWCRPEPLPKPLF